MARKNKTAPERCAEIYKYIKDFLKMKGYPPSVREIGEKVGLSSSSTVHSYLHMLEADGKIHRDPTKPRAIELVGDNPWENLLRVPLVGNVAAGVPITAEENIEEVFSVPSSLIPSAIAICPRTMEKDRRSPRRRQVTIPGPVSIRSSCVTK